MTRVKNEPKTDLELTAKKPPSDELAKGRSRSRRATPKKPRDDAQARQRARERAARDD
jgi:hypothetical protein